MEEVNYEERLSIRLFSNIRDKIRYIVKNATDESGLPKYESESHAIRSAFILFIKHEEMRIKERGVKSGTSNARRKCAR